MEFNLWNQLLVHPITNALVAFYKLFEFLKVPGPLGFAVIGLTITMRFLLYPLVMTQLRSAKKMQLLKPKLDALSKRHKEDKVAHQQAQMQLYKDEGINPAAGCLPTLLQFPVLIALYNVFLSVINAKDLQKTINDINNIVYHPILKISNFDTTFFGLSLNIKPNEWQKYGIWLVLIPIITAAFQWYQTKLMMNTNQSVPVDDKSIVKKEDKDKKAEKPPEDMAQEMQKQMAIISPLMFGYFAYSFPIGLALYWNVFGLFGMIQQLIVNKEIQHESK